MTPTRGASARRPSLDLLATKVARAIGSALEESADDQPVTLLVTMTEGSVSVRVAAPLGSDGDPPTFASWLTSRLEAQRFTKLTLAGKLGVSERTVRRWLAGHSEPRFQELLRLTELLGSAPL